MVVDDRTRLNLHRRLEDVLGSEEADTLMAHLPPVTWHDVATKDDLRVLEASLRAEMRVVSAELRTELANALTRQTKWLVAVVVTFNAAWGALLITSARLMA